MDASNLKEVADKQNQKMFLCYACDIKVITLLSTRGLGNSATQLQRKLDEQHHRRWLTQTARYLSDCKIFGDSRLCMSTTFADPPAQIPTPRWAWLQTVYCIDVMSRLGEVKAAITSTFGSILKMDSTKKVVKKLVGPAKDTAAWCTNIGNEHGQVLMSVLTCEEGYGGLGPMVNGIIQRYEIANKDPPKVLYVDRDCYGQSFTGKLFQAWPDLLIRLDIWHFMRRFTSGCTTDAHQLYGVFMSRLSKCIFEWSSEDLKLLRDAKRAELRLREVRNPSSEDIIRWITKAELAKFCRRRTRGTEETTKEIEQLLETFLGDAGLDTLGVPLFDKEKMMNIWVSQKPHVACIQDPDDISLYTDVRTTNKGGVQLKQFRCARGSTSLESFHNHLAKFIPGTTASDTHFQAYLLEGVRRWNEDRDRQKSSDTKSTSTSYSGLLRQAVNELSQQVLAKKLVEDFIAPRKYTGEKIGIEYLYSQTGKVMQDVLSDPEDMAQIEPDPSDETLDEEDPDEGFADMFEPDDQTLPPIVPSQLDMPPVPRKRISQPIPEMPVVTAEDFFPTTGDQPTQIDKPPQIDNQPDEQDQASDEEAVGPDNIEGFIQVDKLATYLFSLRDQTRPLSNDQADHIIRLWNRLSTYDSQSTVPKPRHQTRLTKGSITTFKVRSKPSCVPGVDSIKRAFHGAEGGAAQRPDSNRYMEQLIIKLSSAYVGPIKQGGKRIDRWSQISRAYRDIRELIVSNPRVMEQTGITLYAINNKTLTLWYTKRVKDQEKQMLVQNIPLADPPMAASPNSKLPSPKVQVPIKEMSPVPPHHAHIFDLPPITVGSSTNIRGCRKPSASPANPDSELISSSSQVQSKSVDVAKTTRWYRERINQKQAAGEYVKTNVRRRKDVTFTYSKCGNLRTKEDHSQYYGQWYCKTTATESYEEWRSSKEKCRQAKKQLQKDERENLDDDEKSGRPNITSTLIYTVRDVVYADHRNTKLPLYLMELFIEYYVKNCE